jgi:hypothetical protein
MADGQDDSIVDPQNGLFQAHQVFHSPGPGGAGSPLGGMLDFLNAFKGQDLANQAQASRNVAAMHAAQQLQPMDYNDVQGMADTVGTSTGLGPVGAEQMSQNSPAMLYRSKIASLQQQYPQGIPTSELETAALATGQNTQGLYSYMGRTQGIDAGAIKNFDITRQKNYANALQNAETDVDARRMTADLMLGTHPQFKDVLEQWVAQGSPDPTPMALARKNKTVAQGEQATAGASASTARAAYLGAITDPTVKNLLSKSHLEDVQSKLAETHTEIEKIKAANGGVLPEAQKPKYMQILAQLEGRLQAQAAQGSLGIKPNPSVVADLHAAIKDVEAKVNAKAAGTAAAPAVLTWDPATGTAH